MIQRAPAIDLFGDIITKQMNHHYYDLSRGNYVDFFANTGSSTLLITIGESWTWGDSLPGDRLQSVWGRQLCNNLKTDWLNIARPGASNFWIMYQLAELVRFAKQNTIPYNHAVIVFCLTETGRELNENWSYIEQDPSKAFDSMPRDIGLSDLVHKQNKYVMDFCHTQSSELLEFLPHDIWIGHNFCSPIHWQHPYNKITQTWVEIIAKKLQLPYNAHPSVVKADIISRYKQHLSLTDNFMAEIDQAHLEAMTMIDFLDKSPLNYKRATKHPNAEAHALWADFVFDSITKQGK